MEPGLGRHLVNGIGDEIPGRNERRRDCSDYSRVIGDEEGVTGLNRGDVMVVDWKPCIDPAITERNLLVAGGVPVTQVKVIFGIFEA